MKKLLALLLSLMLVISLFAAGGDTSNTIDDENIGGTLEEADKADTAEPVTINIASMKGPTTMGMVKLMDDSDNGLTANKYATTI